LRELQPIDPAFALDRAFRVRYKQPMSKLLIRLIAWLLLAAVLFVTVSPIQMRPVTAAPPDVERFAAFAAVGLAFVIGYPRHWRVVACLVVAAALAFEAAQLLAPSRHARVADALVKAFGGLFGIAVGAVIQRLSPPRD
jgi:VanZ family protein